MEIEIESTKKKNLNDTVPLDEQCGIYVYLALGKELLHGAVDEVDGGTLNNALQGHSQLS